MSAAGRERDDVKWLVMAVRQDGYRRLFQAYASEREATSVADRLRSVGCPVEVVRNGAATHDDA